MSKSVIEIVNEKIIAKLEAGINPWVKPWVDGYQVQPRNMETFRYYSGINNYLLKGSYFLTFKQVQELGGKIKKGAKSQIVIFSKMINKENLSAQEIAMLSEEERFKRGVYYCLQYFNVFEAEDIENIDELKLKDEYKNQVKKIVVQNTYFKEFDDRLIEQADKIITDYLERENIKVEHQLNRGAFYSPLEDSITLPYSKQFESVTEYYSTVFHELAHSTGYITRLNRDIGNGFGTQKYSKEELIAEITAVLCLNALGIDSNQTESNSTAYLKGWADHLSTKTNSWLILSATKQAEQAFKRIFNIKDAENEE